MLGHKAREFKQHKSISLEDLVPDENFYRQVQRSLDLSFVRELVDEYYASMGRPSIDPVVFFKLQLIAFFEGIRSERQLMDTVNLNLAHRWFIGYDLDEPVPDHSSLSKIRERFGLEVFQQFFEQIVELCIEAGLVWGEELYFDSTKVQANANLNGMIDRAKYEAKQHLDQLFEEPLSPFSRLVAKYNGKRIIGIRKPHYQRITDDQVSPIDPDATPMQSSHGGNAMLGYRDHYIVDGGKARIILSALVTPASITDNTPLLDLVDWVCSRWRIEPKIAAGDTKYGTVPNIVGLEERGIKAYLPTSDFSQRTKYYSAKLFQYDSEKDHYVCPQGQILLLVSRRKSEQVLLYKSKAEVCNACPLKSKCTGSKSGRYIFRSFFQEYLDKAETYRQTEAYLKAMRKRSLWVEPLFGEAKEFHRLKRFRLRRLLKVNIEGVMVAAGQNLKRLIQHHLESFFSFLKFPSRRLISLLILTFSTGWNLVVSSIEFCQCKFDEREIREGLGGNYDLFPFKFSLSPGAVHNIFAMSANVSCAGCIILENHSGILEHQIMPEHYQHLGIFSDWVAAARRQHSLYPTATPGLQTQELLRETLGFCHTDESPAEVKLEREWQKDGLIGQEISWSVGFGPRTHAYVFKPAKGTKPLPGIVALHDHSGFKYYGKEKIADGPEETLPVLSDFRKVPYGGRAYANALAQEGFVVLVHDVFLWGSRGFPLETMIETMDSKTAAIVKAQSDEIERYNTATNYHEDRVSKYCNILGTSMAGVVAYEDRIALNYLLSRPDVDVDRTACIGLSGGGNRAALLSATHDSLKAAVIIGLMTTYEALLDHNMSHTWMLFPFGWGRHGDWPDIAACRAPVPLLVQYDLQDYLFTETGMKDAHARLQGHYAGVGKPDAYTGQFYPGTHKFDLEMQSAAFDWLKKQLLKTM